MLAKALLHPQWPSPLAKLIGDQKCAASGGRGLATWYRMPISTKLRLARVIILLNHYFDHFLTILIGEAPA